MFKKNILKINFKDFYKGFTLLFSLIVISVVLSVGLAVYTILMKEFKLSFFGKESQMAFYAADSGIECIFYWDIKRSLISTTTPRNITCNNQTVSAGGSPISTLTLNFENGACDIVTIDKSNPSFTRVESRGYNTCNVSSPVRLERAIRSTY